MIFFRAPDVKGEDGAVSESLIKYGTLDAASKKRIPAELLIIVRRKAVDLLLGDRNNQRGRDALRFIIDVASGRNDVEQIRKGNFLEKLKYARSYPIRNPTLLISTWHSGSSNVRINKQILKLSA